MGAELRVRVLGEFEVNGIAGPDLGSRKARTLLKMLTLARGVPVSVDVLVDALWPEVLPAEPADQVSVLVSRLRSTLGTDRLMRTDAGYSLRRDWLDLDEAAALLEEAARRLSAGRHASARTAIAGCLALMRGPLLADEGEAAWAAGERTSAERLAVEARRVGAAAALAMGDHAAAIEMAEHVLVHDPYDEHALRLAMRALAGAGRPGDALLRYEQARARLSDELGVDPGPETRALHTTILRGTAREALVLEDGTGPPELPGRTAELGALDAELALTAGSAVRVVLVEGEAGIGKTRLVSAWAERAINAGAMVLRGSCSSVGRTLPLQPILDAISGLLVASEREAAGDLLGADAPLVGPLLDWRTGEAARVAIPGSPGEPSIGPTLLFGALLRVCRRIAGGSTAVLIVEDIHMASAATLDWIDFAGRRGDGLPLLIVATRRPEDVRPLPARRVIQLGALDVNAARLVVGEERAAELHRRSGGNPLFLAELANADRDDELPTSLRAAVMALCDRTGPAAATLRNAAVIGSSVDLELLAAATRTSPMVLLDHLEEGVRHRLLEEGGDGFRFRHELVRDALVAASSPARRALLHREAGHALAARSSPDPFELAHHARLGGDAALASEALVRAARIAWERFDNAESERLLDEATALRDGAESRLARARIRVLRGRYDEARQDAEVAISSGGGAPAMEMAGTVAYYRRELTLARDLADEGLRIAADPRARAGCLVLSSRALHALGDLELADARISEAIELAHSTGMPAPYVILGNVRVHQGRAGEALEVLARVGSGPDASGHIYAAFSPVHVHFITGYALGTLGRPAAALERFEEGSREVARLGAARYAGLGDAWKGWIIRQLGCLSEADECNARSEAAAADAGYLESQAYSLLDLADGRLVAGDLDGAQSFLQRAQPLQRIEHAYRWRHQLRARWLAARLALAGDRAEEALRLSTALRTDAARFSSARYQVLAALTEARARGAVGAPVDLDESSALLARCDQVAGMEAWWLAAEHGRSLGVDRWTALAGERVEQLAALAGDRADAFRRHAATRLQRIGNPDRDPAALRLS